MNGLCSTFAFELTFLKWVRTSEHRMSARVELSYHFLCDGIQFSLWLVVAGSVPLLFETKSKKTPTTLREISSIRFDLNPALHALRLVLISHHSRSLNILVNIYLPWHYDGEVPCHHLRTVKLHLRTCKIIEFSVLFALHKAFDVCFSCFH